MFLILIGETSDVRYSNHGSYIYLSITLLLIGIFFGIFKNEPDTFMGKYFFRINAFFFEIDMFCFMFQWEPMVVVYLKVCKIVCDNMSSVFISVNQNSMELMTVVVVVVVLPSVTS